MGWQGVVALKNLQNFGEPRIQNFRTDRVWLDYDSNHKIANVPTMG